MTDVSIRLATRDDIAHLSALIIRTVRVSNVADYSAASIEVICANFTPEKVLEKMAVRDVFVALDKDGAPCGTVSLGNIRSADGQLHSMFVAPERQKAGIGRLMVTHLERHAREAKALDNMWLFSSLTARAFYERLGYTMLAPERQGDIDMWRMAKRLA